MLRTIILTATLALTLAAPSFGHAKLLSSYPAGGAQVSEVPKTITLTFNEETKLAALTLLHAGKQTSVAVDKSAPAAKSVVVPVAGKNCSGTVPHGRWTINSRVGDAPAAEANIGRRSTPAAVVPTPARKLRRVRAIDLRGLAGVDGEP